VILENGGPPSATIPVALLALLAVILAGATLAIPAQAEEPGVVVLFDFEDAGLSDDFTVSGPAQASRLPIPDPPEGGPTGSGVRVQARRPASLVSHPGRVPGDWSEFDALALRIRRAPAEGGDPSATPEAQSTALDPQLSVSIEIGVHEVDGNASFRRRVDLVDVGWTRVELPLRWFRWGDGRVPRWDRVDHLVVSFREPGTYWIDDIELLRPAGEAVLAPTAEELAALAAPDRDGSSVTVLRTPDVQIVSAAPALDAGQLADHLGEVRAAVIDELAFVPADIGPAPLVVLPDDAEFVAFVRGLAEAFSGRVDPPEHGGYTMLGIASVGWSAEFGTLRPTYAHEYVHALVSAGAGLPNLGEWFQEGLATRFQLRFHPQADVPDIVRRGVASPSLHLPLPELCSGKPIPIDRYWQAMTVVDLLLEGARYRDSLPALVGAFLASGSTDLAPHLGTVFGVTWEQFEADWRSHVATKLSPEEAPETGTDK